MQPTIEAGDRVRGILWRGEPLTDGSIYVLHLEPGRVIYRRVRLEGEEVRLEADNPELDVHRAAADTWQRHFRPVARLIEVARAL